MMAQSTSHNRRRDKPILSCTFCRGRKLRCDRQSPCSACARRGKPAECTYSSSEQERRDAVDYRPHARSQATRQRLARLESLVTELRDREHSSRQQSQQIASPSETPRSPLALSEGHLTDSMGKLSLTDSHAVYTGSSHWVAVLEDIQHLKDELSDEDLDHIASRESTPFDANLMHGSPATRVSLLTSATPLSQEQILAMVPPRQIVDRHVSQFFNTLDLAPFIIHRNKFLAEYANFWVNPSAVPVMWIGLLFSIMSVSVFLQQQDVGAHGLSTAESQDMLETYRALTIHCLVAGDYIQPSRYTIETLTLHFTVDQNVNVDTFIGNWILIGVIIRIAMRMGLHRDPSHWPNIRPLQAELRRRLWIMLYQMDFFTSTQVGLPRIIKDSQCDTHPPAHLFEHDLSFEHEEIPPERPLTDPSPLLFVIQRNAIVKVAAEIYDATEAAPPSPATIAALGTKLERAVGAIPAWLKYTSFDTSVIDNPGTMLHRMFLDILIHKAIYLLHRRSFVKGSDGEESTNSNKLCVDAALRILEHQRRLSEETQTGGLMFGVRWKVISSINHEFLQATMMLCFALKRFDEESAGTTNPRALYTYRRDDIREALVVAKSLWEKNANESSEARRAAKAIATVLVQALDKSPAPTLVSLDDFSEQMLGVAATSYPGSFDYWQNMALNPSFPEIDDSIAASQSLMDQFITDGAEENFRKAS